MDTARGPWSARLAPAGRGLARCTTLGGTALGGRNRAPLGAGARRRGCHSVLVAELGWRGAACRALVLGDVAGDRVSVPPRLVPAIGRQRGDPSTEAPRGPTRALCVVERVRSRDGRRRRRSRTCRPPCPPEARGVAASPSWSPSWRRWPRRRRRVHGPAARHLRQRRHRARQPVGPRLPARRHDVLHRAVGRDQRLTNGTDPAARHAGRRGVGRRGRDDGARGRPAVRREPAHLHVLLVERVRAPTTGSCGGR